MDLALAVTMRRCKLQKGSPSSRLAVWRKVLRTAWTGCELNHRHDTPMHNLGLQERTERGRCADYASLKGPHASQGHPELELERLLRLAHHTLQTASHVLFPSVSCLLLLAREFLASASMVHHTCRALWRNLPHTGRSLPRAPPRRRAACRATDATPQGDENKAVQFEDRNRSKPIVKDQSASSSNLISAMTGAFIRPRSGGLIVTPHFTEVPPASALALHLVFAALGAQACVVPHASAADPLVAVRSVCVQNCRKGSQTRGPKPCSVRTRCHGRRVAHCCTALYASRQLQSMTLHS